MKAGWEVVPMAQLCSIKSGKSDTKNAVENGQYAFFDRSRIIKRSSRYIFDCEALIIPGEGAEFLPKHFVGKFDLHQRAYALFEFSNLIDVKYLYYFLHHVSEYFPRVAVGATVKSLRLRHFEDLPVTLTSRSEQQRIVAILDQAFEGIAKARANAEQNLQNARALFESHLQSVFTQRDEGWVESTLDDVCDLITCGVAATPKYVDEAVGVPFLSAQNVRDGEVVLDKFRHISKEFHRELTKKNKPAKGDVLYSRVGSKFGEAGVVEHDFEFSVYVSLTLIKPKPEILNSYFLKHYLNSAFVKSIALKSISSSGVPNLNVKDVRQFPIKLPSISQQVKFVGEINELRLETQRLEALYQRKIACLDELKKSLLQQAFAGEL